MASATRLPDTDMGNWPPGVRHYKLSGGGFLAVEVDTGLPEEMTEAVARIAGPVLLSHVPRPTVILSVDADGNAVTLDRLHEFPPGTTHEDALTRAGYDV